MRLSTQQQRTNAIELMCAPPNGKGRIQQRKMAYTWPYICTIQRTNRCVMLDFTRYFARIVKDIAVSVVGAPVASVGIVRGVVLKRGIRVRGPVHDQSTNSNQSTQAGRQPGWCGYVYVYGCVSRRQEGGGKGWLRGCRKVCFRVLFTFWFWFCVMSCFL